MSALRSPRKTGSLPGKRFGASYKYGRCSRVDGGRYALIRVISWSLATSSKLTTLVLWKRVNSKIYPFGRSRDTIPTPPCAPPSAVTVASENTTSHPIQLQQYTTFGIFVSVKRMRS